MLEELRVRNLGVIEDQTVVLGAGMTALTGETGAGKTLLIDAIELLTGGPADPTLVRAGAAEAIIEGRFVTSAAVLAEATGTGDAGDGAGEGAADDRAGEGEAGEGEADEVEVILSRVVPARGRSRCYVDGRMVAAAQLGALGRALVDIHGQHAHQSLLAPATQRHALDRAGSVDTTEVERARREVRELRAAQAGLGGDARERARRLDLLTYQLKEIDDAGLDDPDEDRALQDEEELLADAAGLVEAAGAAWQALAGDDGVVERLGAVVSATAGRKPLDGLHRRLAGLQEELTDVAGEARDLSESVEDDPGRLAAIGERRRVLTELRRKYGGTLAEVIAYREEIRAQVDELESYDARAAAIEADLERAEKELDAALTRLWEARRAAAPAMSAAIEAELRELAMRRARFSVDVGADPAREEVTWLLGANPGQPMLPLAKVASGGELARAMLAARLVVGRAQRAGTAAGATAATTGPVTLVFDEVDAGIGGEAATAVGRALGALGRDSQVLVVTHLAQVAAFADHHLAVAKEVVDDTATVARARPVSGGERVVELARMLSGRPDSDSARQHAEELLASARAASGTPGPDRPAGTARVSTRSGPRRR